MAGQSRASVVCEEEEERWLGPSPAHHLERDGLGPRHQPLAGLDLHPPLPGPARQGGAEAGQLRPATANTAVILPDI